MSERITKADVAIAAAVSRLREHPPGTELRSSEFGDVISNVVGGLSALLSKGVSDGRLCVRVDERRRALWKIGEKMWADAPDEAQKVVRLSSLAAPSIFAYADQRGAAEFSCAASSDGRITFERNGRVLLELTAGEAALARATILAEPVKA